MIKRNPSVYIEHPDHLTDDLFRGYGWSVVYDPYTADFICFTGGSDIHPSLYGEEPIPHCFYNTRRDKIEVDLFNSFPDKPKLGICRGGQLLNALSGGRMWQDVNNHGVTHECLDLELGIPYRVTSCHHQMMRPKQGVAEILSVSSRATRKIAAHESQTGLGEDIENVFYPNTHSLCFQGHPEYGLKECADYFFSLINRKFGA